MKKCIHLCPCEEGGAGREPSCLNKSQIAIVVEVWNGFLQEVCGGLKVSIENGNIPMEMHGVECGDTCS